jgi:hypothetical protein
MIRKVRGLKRFAWVLIPLLAFAGGACTDEYLYNPKRDDQPPRDRTLSIEGEFCTPGANDVVRPIKILIAMDASQSMSVTDPDGSRARAAVQLMDALPQDPEIYLAVMLFAGSTSAWLTRNNQPNFEQVISYTTQDKANLQQGILNFTNPSTMANRDSTDFVKPLADIYAMVSRDIATTRLAALSSGKEARARYSIIFLSDGQPTQNQDLELLCQDAVSRIRALKDLAEDVRVNTVHVFRPTQPIASSNCDIDGGYVPPVGPSAACGDLFLLPPGACPLLIINTNALRLEKMAAKGGGDFRDFRNNEPINFLNFNFGQVRRAWQYDKMVASNFSALPGSPDDRADTDSDFIADDEELDPMNASLPWVVDTDGDGFSDAVEIKFGRQGANFTPNQVMRPDGGGLDPGCPPNLRGVDSDCDGLLDCDEQIIGTNSLLTDSDDDGIPDSVEWQIGTQASSRDLIQDPDIDGVDNGDELLLHTDPLTVDTDKLASIGYRYHVQKSGPPDEQGRQCFTFRVDNIALAPTMADTRDAGNPDGGAPLFRRGAGFNDIYLSFSVKPGDDPTARTLVKQWRYNGARYPVGGIKLPVDGVLRITPQDFVSQCGAQTTTP